MQWKNKISEILLIIILLVGISLRFYDFHLLPFTWDELSAWNRLHFNSLSELIELGIKPDGHPAGVQVFLYYWTHLFGEKEWLVKLPFALMGVSSIYVFYKIAEIWWNKHIALISASFMASLQFFVLYSTIARPYISGLFLTLLMMYYWSQFMFNKPLRKYLIGFIIFASLSAYNHHFSLLFAAIVGISGLFIIPKKHLRDYIISGILIFLLYAPHLPVFFHQLGIGGIGGTGRWLAKPSPNFILEFLHWAFHYSPFVIGSIILLIIIGILQKKNDIIDSKKLSKRMLLLSWFLLPILIGYFYSRLVNPVIQYSMLIFSFPYLLLFIFSGIKRIKAQYLILIIFGILTINITSLIYSRQHYSILLKQPFDKSAQALKEQENKKPNNTFLIYNTIITYQDYYLKKHKIEYVPNYSIYNTAITSIQFDSLLRSINKDQVLLCGLPENLITIAQNRFPYFIERIDGYTYESYLLSKKKVQNKQLNTLIDSLNFKNSNSNWSIKKSRVELDSLGKQCFTYKENQEWGFNFSDSLKNIIPYYGCIIDFQADIFTTDENLNANWACTFSSLNYEQVWRGLDMKHNLIKTPLGYKLYFSLDTRLLMNDDDYNSCILKTYFWNSNKQSFNISGLRMYYREPNPIKYGLFYPID